MPVVDYKLIVIGVLFAVLFLVKLLAGGRPYDKPVRRRRRFGHRGSLSPLRQAEQGPDGKPRISLVDRPAEPEGPPPDPEKEFFGED